MIINFKLYIIDLLLPLKLCKIFYCNSVVNTYYLLAKVINSLYYFPSFLIYLKISTDKLMLASDNNSYENNVILQKNICLQRVMNLR